MRNCRLSVMPVSAYLTSAMFATAAVSANILPQFLSWVFSGVYRHGWPFTFMVREYMSPDRDYTFAYGPWPFDNPRLISFSTALLGVNMLTVCFLTVLVAPATRYWLGVHRQRAEFVVRAVLAGVVMSMVAATVRSRYVLPIAAMILARVVTDGCVLALVLSMAFVVRKKRVAGSAGEPRDFEGQTIVKQLDEMPPNDTTNPYESSSVVTGMTRLRSGSPWSRRLLFLGVTSMTLAAFLSVLDVVPRLQTTLDFSLFGFAAFGVSCLSISFALRITRRRGSELSKRSEDAVA